MQNLRLRAELIIELDAADFVEAAEHQNRLQKILEQLHDVYPHAKLAIRERRMRGPKLERVAQTARARTTVSL